MSDLSDRIRARGHWLVVVRPATFIERRIEKLTDLWLIAQRSQVRLRGWYFPQVVPNVDPSYGNDWVGQESQYDHYLGAWRFYRSGQFIDLSAFMEDWRDESTLWPAPPGWQPGRELMVGGVLFRFTEIFEFAARLALSAAGDTRIRIESTLRGLSGRMLVGSHPWEYWLDGSRRTAEPELTFQSELDREELVAAPRELALNSAIAFFQSFGWDADPDLLREKQKTLRR